MAANDIEQTHINVEVAFAEPHRQRVVALAVPPDTSARDAVVMADFPALFPERGEAFFEHATLGIYGQALRAPEQRTLVEGDRVEIYRPLTVDPKQARLARARGDD
ncbi:RnfH family protein [Chromohalobacter sp. HP20-39]|uniref:RnfH family protein n=1 Tax=Chromohalobacter sp. HP20-39 TaxID=3079306 RepID=UPI00294B8923|nr:RnfH family protein [Chromohalobacter sp. HP20-39]MDV6318613.1 RnfH family protein [Chromohalobacter sp. HP20-39]